jgi:DNA-binding SARP family transcriptional activator
VRLDWEQVKLTADEAQALLAARVTVDPIRANQLYEQSGGWAAGLTLLAERLRYGEDIPETAAPESLEEVFAYFATELFDRAPEEQRLMLMQLSWPPRLTEAQAEMLTGDPSARKLLDQLYRRHLFTDRRSGASPVYQFHALFRAFLQHRARTAFSESDRDTLARRAAQILDIGGHPGEAIGLYLQAADAAAAEALVLREAPGLIAHGRWKVVVEWLSALPQDHVCAHPWLLYWFGTAQIAVHPDRARGILERCHELSEARADPLCALLAAAGVVQTYMMEYRQFRPFDRWIPVFAGAFDEGLAFPNSEVELRVLCAFLVALSYRNPTHPRVTSCIERVFELVHTGADVGGRLHGAFCPLFHGTTTGLLRTSHRAEPMVRSLIEHPEVPAQQRAVCWFALSWYYCRCNAYEQCLDEIARAQEIAQANGLLHLLAHPRVIGAWMEIQRNNLDMARAWLNRLEEVVVPANKYETASYHGIKGWLAVLDNQPELAIAHGRIARETFDEAGSHMHRINFRCMEVWGAILKKDWAAAREGIAEAREIAGADPKYWAKSCFLASEAYMALQEGDRAGAVECMRLALAAQREQEHDFAMMQWNMPCVPELISLALEAGVETDYARKLIRLCKYDPPSLDAENWPWPVRICVLGRFEVLIDDKALNFVHKTPRKPLSLLKALVCRGRREVRDYVLIDALWPEEDGDAARDAYRVTVHRLRKLLGRTDALLVEDGRLALNPKLCWVDAWAFEQLTDDETEPGTPEKARRLLSLYRGALLPDDAEEPWPRMARERLRARFAREVGRAAQVLENREQWPQAVELYERGIEADELMEAFYLGLMRCYQNMDRHAEAISVYRRLAQTLSTTLGMQPSPASQTLYRQLLGRTAA